MFSFNILNLNYIFLSTQTKRTKKAGIVGKYGMYLEWLIYSLIFIVLLCVMKSMYVWS